MTKSRLQSILLHLMATMLLSLGLVKTAEKLEAWPAEAHTLSDKGPGADFPATMPCGNNKF